MERNSFERKVSKSNYCKTVLFISYRIVEIDVIFFDLSYHTIICINVNQIYNNFIFAYRPITVASVSCNNLIAAVYNLSRSLKKCTYKNIFCGCVQQRFVFQKNCYSVSYQRHFTLKEYPT